MAGRSDAFNQASGRNPEPPNGTAAAASNIPATNGVAAPRYGRTKSSGTPLGGDLSRTVLEEGITQRGSEEVLKATKIAGHQAAMNRDRSAFKRQMTTPAGSAPSAPMLNGQPFKPSHALAKGQEIGMQLHGHLTQLEAAFPNHEVIGPITRQARQHLLQASDTFKVARGQISDPQSREVRESGSKTVAQGFRHLSEANDLVNSPALLMHRGVPVSPVDTEHLEHHRAATEAIANDPARQFKSRGQAPRSMNIAGANIPTREPEGKAVIRAIGKAAKNKVAGVDQVTAGAIVESAKGTPKKRKADKEALRQAGIPVNTKTLTQETSSNMMKSSSARFEAYPHPNDRRPSSAGTGMARVNVNTVDPMSINPKQVEAQANPARGMSDKELGIMNQRAHDLRESERLKSQPKKAPTKRAKTEPSALSQDAWNAYSEEYRQANPEKNPNPPIGGQPTSEIRDVLKKINERKRGK